MESVQESINIFRRNTDVQNSSAIPTILSEPDPKETSSIFGDSKCGEPLIAQHLVIDFTPNVEDTDYSQKKCCEFWDFINGIPELQDMIVFPEQSSQTKQLDAMPSSSEINKTSVEDEDTVLNKTALSMLEFVEEKGLIDRIFEAKLPQSMCSLGSREYENKDKEEIMNRNKPKMTGKSSANNKDKESGVRDTDGTRTTKCIQLKNLVQDMEEWDSKHPKSMEPPGHPPQLHHCILQRL